MREGVEGHMDGGIKFEEATRSAHLGLVLLLDFLTVLRNELLVFLAHVIEGLGEINARSNIYFHMDIPVILPSQLGHLLPGKKEIGSR